MAKAIRNLSVFNKIDVTCSIRNLSSQEFQSALGKISVVNFMYSLLGKKIITGWKFKYKSLFWFSAGYSRYGGDRGLFKKAEIRISEIWQRMRPTRPCREWPAENQNKVLYLHFQPATVEFLWRNIANWTSYVYFIEDT